MKILPAPVGGWNARDPLHAMAETDAIEMVNFFPESASVVPRGGCTKVYQEAWASNQYVYDLFALPSPTIGSAGKLYAITDTGAARKLLDVNFNTGATSDVTGGVSLSAGYQSTIFRGKIFAVNGSNAPFDIGSTGAAAATAWTGSGLTIANLVNVDSYKGRLYFIEKNSGNIWYGALDGVTGALTKYDLSSFLTRGGALVAIGSTTKQTGNLNQNYFVAASSAGEVLVFSGDWPGSSTWGLIGRFYTAPVMGYKGLFYRGANLHLITADGIIAIGTLLANDVVNDKYRTISDKIQNAFRDAADHWIAAGATTSWAACFSSSHRMLLLNATGAVGGVWPRFFVQNIETQAWCEFEISLYLNASNFVCLDNRVFFSDLGFVVGGSGIPGAIYELHRPNVVSYDANNSYGSTDKYGITSELRQAFNFLDDPTVSKHITGVKGFFSATVGTALVSQSAGIHMSGGVDFDEESQYFFARSWANDPKFVVDYSDNYKQIIHVPLEGTAFSIWLHSYLLDDWELEYKMAIVAYESGGFLS